MLKGYIVAMSRKKTHVPDKALLWKFFFEAVNTFGIVHNVPLILKLRTNDHRWDHLQKNSRAACFFGIQKRSSKFLL